MHLGSRVGRFWDDTQGGITALTITVFVVMLISVGMAVDFMRHETYRAELQDAVDRGVLAAAAFDQTVDAEVTIRAYLKTTSFVRDGYSLDVSDNSTDNLRRISAVASYPVETFFLKLIGINTLGIEASGEAIEGTRQVEISMVFDISGSMATISNGSTLSRIEVLRSSATSFVNGVFDRDPTGAATISLIPYAGGVNAGEVAFDHFVDSQVHSYSRCLEFADTDYTLSTMPTANTLSQIQHFESNRHSPADHALLGWGACPSNVQEIEYFSANREALIARIQGLKGHDYTGTYYGMKWANMLSDPEFNTITQKLVTSLDVSSEQSHLPGDFGVASTKKYIILMSDGNTTRTQVVKSSKYQNDDDYAYFAANRATDEDDLIQTVNAVDNRALLIDACTTAKNNGVIVFTIGFDIVEGSNAHTDLSACATDTSKFFDVDGEDLVNAFDAIAATIQKLRLSY